jgi:hypothetical protein
MTPGASLSTLIHSDATGFKSSPHLIHVAQRCRLKPAAFAFVASAFNELSAAGVGLLPDACWRLTIAYNVNLL